MHLIGRESTPARTSDENVSAAPSGVVQEPASGPLRLELRGSGVSQQKVLTPGSSLLLRALGVGFDEVQPREPHVRSQDGFDFRTSGTPSTSEWTRAHGQRGERRERAASGANGLPPENT